MRVACVFGTRPEIIKLSPIIDELKRTGVDPVIVHTGQHYDYEMSEIFIKELAIPEPDYHLGVRSERPGRRFAEIVDGLERVLGREEPDTVLVQGDTDTVPASLLAAGRSGILGGHVEAGLRSFNRASPEELNRRVAAQLAQIHFAPTELNRKFLLAEGVDRARIFVTGNTIVDVVRRVKRMIERDILERLGVGGEGPVLLVTAHRPGNVDRRDRLRSIFQALLELEEFRVVFPMHPRTRKRAEEFGLMRTLTSAEHIRVTEPLGYVDFLSLMAASDVVLTDSGGLQEEACELKKPVVVMRETTPRWEAVIEGFAFLAGTDERRIVGAVRGCLSDDLMERLRRARNPFGDGMAGRRIVRILRRIGSGLHYQEPDRKEAEIILRRVREIYAG
jgi:UDP-N-acetylglucosamine 2-epimerase (non-hydrolysing)